MASLRRDKNKKYPSNLTSLAAIFIIMTLLAKVINITVKKVVRQCYKVEPIILFYLFFKELIILSEKKYIFICWSLIFLYSRIRQEGRATVLFVITEKYYI